MNSYSKILFVTLIVLLLLPSTVYGNKRCSKVVLHAWCSAESTERNIHAILNCGGSFSFQERRCRVNDEGDFCGSFVEYLIDIQRARALCLEAPSSPCSNQCRQQLEVLQDALGCCINEMLNATTQTDYRQVFAYPLWSKCQVEPVKKCLPSRLMRVTSTSTMNCTFEELFQTRFKEQCKNSTLQPLLDYYESHRCAEIGEDQVNSCGMGEDGKWCVEKLLTNITSHRQLRAAARTNCPTSNNCSTACRNTLLALKSNLGCCVNNLLNNTFVKLIYTETYFNKNITHDALWRNCGVPHPGYCQVQLFNTALNYNSFWMKALQIIVCILVLQLCY